MTTLSGIITPSNVATATSTTTLTNKTIAYASNTLTDVVGVTATQTLTNKTLTAPTIASANLTTALTLAGAAGTNGQVLTSAGSGLPSWTTISAGFTLGTPVATTSGTSVTFTGIPAGTKQIIVSFNEVSTSGTSYVIVQIGDAGGIEITGYQGSGVSILGIVVDQASASAGYLILSANAGHKLSGSITLTLENATAFTWAATGSWGDGIAANASWFTAGRKSLSATLDRVRITTVNGTDTFDLGEINIAYI